MIKINYDHLLADDNLEDKYRDKLEDIKSQPAPAFETARPDLGYIREKAGEYGKYKNIISIGNGGSRTSAWAYYRSLADLRNDVIFEFVTSPEPEMINRIKKVYSPEDTLVLIISKSGDNINSIEPLISLLDYPTLVITGEKENVLSQIAAKKNWNKLPHPEVGGRYSGMTMCGLMPAALMGLPVDEIYSGAQAGYEKYNNQNEIVDNDALKLALYFYELEEKGYVDIFTGIYSTPLFGFFPLLVQLIHESCGKDGKGQTIFGDLAPESQHHTNQRFFGGRKNVAGLFIGQEKSVGDFDIAIPNELKDIPFKNGTLGSIDGNSARGTLHYDMKGVIQNAVNKKIPVAEIWVDGISPKTIGEYMVFWHYFTMYSAQLRNQNPFDQPEVEDAKVISFKLRTTK